MGYKYEFPGGKVEIGEHPEQALLREIDEELGYAVTVDRFLQTVPHEYPDFRISMHTYSCRANDRLHHLREHIDAIWLIPADLFRLDWAAADKPIVKYLINEYALMR